MKSLQEVLREQKLASALRKSGIRQDEWQAYLKNEPAYLEQVGEMVEISTIDELAEAIKIEVRGWQKSANDLFRYSGISSRHIRRIKQATPSDQWQGKMEEAVARREGREKRTPKHFAFINHELVNLRLLKEIDDLTETEPFDTRGGEMVGYGERISYADLFLLSGIYNFIEYKRYEFSVRELHHLLNPEVRWYRLPDAEKAHWKSLVAGCIERMKAHRCHVEWQGAKFDGGEEILLNAKIEGEIIHVLDSELSMDGKHPLLYTLSQEKRFVQLPDAFLKAGRCKIEWLEKLYVARKIRLSSNHKNQLRNSVLWDTMRKDLGQYGREQVKGYLKHLQRQGVVEGFTATARSLEWQPVAEAQGDCHTIEMKGENGAVVKDIDLPSDISRAGDKIASYNDYMRNHAVTDANGKALKTDLHAIYNGDWSQGGRLYLYDQQNGYQGMKKAERAKIKIDGKETAEIDYGNTHVSILYAVAGATLEGDAYDFASPRQTAKTALLRAIDATSERSAELSIAKHLAGLDGADKVDIPTLEAKVPEARDLLAKAQARHPALKPWFFKGAGLQAQNVDASIMLSVLTTLTARKIPALCVHDSVIVPRANVAEVRDIMRRAFYEETSAEPTLKVEEA